MTNALNIYQRMNAVMGEISGVNKDKKANFSGGFKYASHDAVVGAVRPHLVKYGIVMTMTLKEHNINGNRLEAVYSVRFTNIDAPADFIENDFLGFGVDNSDKAPGSCISYIKKYALLNSLGLETGDDVDNQHTGHDASHDTKAPSGRAKSKKVAMPKEKSAPSGSGTISDIKESDKFPGATEVSLVGEEGKSNAALTSDAEIVEIARQLRESGQRADFWAEKTSAGNFKLVRLAAVAE